MMVLPASSLPPAVGVNTNVALTLVLLIARSTDAIEKECKVGAPAIAPEQHIVLVIGSELVLKLISLPTVGLLPMFSPARVTVTLVRAAIIMPDVVITMELMP